LAAHRLEVVEASDASAGLELARTVKPDLIILDLNLPGQDGFQFYQALKGDGKLVRLPVLFLTAISVGGQMTPHSLELLAAAKHGIHLEGKYAIMGKPYDPKALIDAIQRLLEGSVGEQEGVGA